MPLEIMRQPHQHKELAGFFIEACPVKTSSSLTLQEIIFSEKVMAPTSLEIEKWPFSAGSLSRK